MVPVSLSYIGKSGYGIWTTIYQTTHWIDFFNLGLGQGLRNKLGASLASNDIESAKKYVSTTYIMVSIISLLILLLFSIIFPFIDWASLFNAPLEYSYQLNFVILFVVLFYCIRFVLKILQSINYAFQHPSIVLSYELLASLLAFGGVVLLTNFTKGSLLFLALTISITPVITLFLASIIFFSKGYKQIRPNPRYFDISKLKSLFNLSGLFFINGVATVILFSTDNFIISHISGPENVPQYAITKQYFGVVGQFFDLFSLPLWNAFTDAYHRKDIKWINKVIKKSQSVWRYSIVAVIVMVFFADDLISFWTRDKVNADLGLSILMALYILMFSYINVYSRFLNGTSKIYLATIYSIFSAILNIPLSFLFGYHLGLGSKGVILATIICILPAVISHPIQTKKVLNATAAGIWNK